MQLISLIALWLLLFAFGRLRSSRRRRFSRFIPGVLFFQVSLTAALLSRLFAAMEFSGDVVDWIGIVERIALYIAFVELMLDLIWALCKRFSPSQTAPALILKNIAFVVAGVVILAAELNSRGFLTSIGSAAILGGFAFILGPGSASQISNISSALSVQVERQFSVGDWVEINGHQGMVANISLNNTYLHDDVDDCYVVMPNSLIDTGTIVNYSRPSDQYFRFEVAVGLPLDMPPGLAIEMLERIAMDHSSVLSDPPIKVFIRSIGEYSIDYFIKFYVSDFRHRARVRREIFCGIWYALNRAGYSLPYPQHELHTFELSEKRHAHNASQQQEASFRMMRNLDLFESLSDQEIRGIASHDRVLNFHTGECVVRRGEVGGSMYVILEGECAVLIGDQDDPDRMLEITRLSKGMIFGEIAALTNAARTASVRATSHLELQEISQRQVSDIFLSNDQAMSAFAKVMTSREAEHQRFTPEQQQNFESGLIDRMVTTFGRLFSG